MPKWLKWVLFWGLTILGVSIALSWLVLIAPFFSDFRRTIVSDTLSKAIGQPLLIETDVNANVGLTTRVTASDVKIPSEGIEGTNLAEMALLQLDIDLFALLKGDVHIDNIKIDGIRVNLLTLSDGTTSWSETTAAPQGNASGERKSVEEGSGIVAYLSDKNAAVTSVNLTIDNDISGFEFLFDLDALNLKQGGGDEGVTLVSHGSVNGHPFQIDGNYPQGAQFITSATMGQAALRIDGQRLSEEQGGGFEGQLSLDSGEIGDFLEILKLKRALEGNGTLTTRLVRQGKRFGVEDLEAVVDLEDGTSIVLKGSADDLMSSLDFDFTINGRFFPEGQPPQKATKLGELELTTIEARLISEGEQLKFEEVHLNTNLFETGLQELGPLSVGRVRRTAEGGLALHDVNLQAGPREAPYITASGDINDLLGFEELEFVGTLAAPARLVIERFQNDTEEVFGGVSAEFEVTDASGQLSLTKLEAKSIDTNLWTMEASAAASSLTSVDGIDFDLNFDIPDGAAFLAALQLDEVDIGEVGVLTSVRGTENGVDTKFSVITGETRIDTAFDLSAKESGGSIVRGTILSEQLNIRDLEKTIESAVLLSSARKKAKQDSLNGKQEREVQPLVLEDQTVSSDLDSTSGVADDGRIVQPLVLDDAVVAAEASKTDPAGRVIQPLVIEAGAVADGKPTDLFDSERFGRNLDLEIGIDFKKIVGQAGVSKLSSTLISKNGKADFGPLEFSYGGGYFNVGAAMNFIETPQLVRVFGATSGWDFGEILDATGLGIKAHGKLKGQFDLTGNYSSAAKFINSMSGSVTVSMVNGNIATSLLDLAGLGLFPWLFSKELQQGYTTIVCAVAPLKIGGGKASSGAIVVETKSVQLVAGGTIDWGKDRIAVRAEPRPVGRPLARSAWPFEVTGRLSNPDFRIRRIRGQKRETAETGTAQRSGARTPCKPDIRQ